MFFHKTSQEIIFKALWNILAIFALFQVTNKKSVFPKLYHVLFVALLHLLCDLLALPNPKLGSQMSHNHCKILTYVPETDRQLYGREWWLWSWGSFCIQHPQLLWGGCPDFQHRCQLWQTAKHLTSAALNFVDDHRAVKWWWLLVTSAWSEFKALRQAWEQKDHFPLPDPLGLSENILTLEGRLKAAFYLWVFISNSEFPIQSLHYKCLVLQFRSKFDRLDLGVES